jgi:glucose-6-phosphate 1-dehydrogenase
MNKLVVVLYGSTGDLVAKKILPALQQNLSHWQNSVAILALGRQKHDTISYLEYVQKQGANIDVDKLKKHVAYLNMDITESHDFFLLKNVLKDLSDTSTVFLHFFALAPSLVGTVSANLVGANILTKKSQNHRILIEKPFGSNKKSAKNAKKQLWKYFDEKQIYRLDHYLGKSVVEHIHHIRFEHEQTKQLFETPIKQVGIFALEQDGVLNRGEYYDQTGATADMVQSHLMQLVSLLFMKKPKINCCDDLINAKVDALKKVKTSKDFVFGQYKGYTAEHKVARKSKTETFVCGTLTIKKTPIFIATGKSMDKKQTSIFVEFENGQVVEFDLVQNKICLNNQVLLEFEQDLPYAKLLDLAANGLRRHFVRFDEVQSSWVVADKIKKQKNAFFVYKNNQTLVDCLCEQHKQLFEKWAK